MTREELINKLEQSGLIYDIDGEWNVIYCKGKRSKELHDFIRSFNSEKAGQSYTSNWSTSLELNGNLHLIIKLCK